MSLVSKLSHCNCDKITAPKKAGWLERILLFLLPHFDIVKTVDGVTVLYLRRFYIWRSKWIGLNFGELYLHHIVKSDDDPDPHDHPWSFLTFILKGGYVDEAWTWVEDLGYCTHDDSSWCDEYCDGIAYLRGPDLEPITAPAVRFRPATHIHRVIIPEGEDAWTLVFATGYKREWSFFTEDGPIVWREYLGIEGDNGS